LVFTLAGQYIVKNIIILIALLSLKIDLNNNLEKTASTEPSSEQLIAIKNQ
tara:strand:- start:498 stop:650 length:153 start_codon:yes stop_codon:yes gene_type:complete